MAYTIKDFKREFLEENVGILPPEKRLAGLSPADAVKHWTPDELLNAMSPEQMERLKKALQSKQPTKRRKSKRSR